MDNNFHVLCGDVNFADYGGKWFRVVPGTNELRYHIIELINWEDACGRDAEGGPTYNVSLSEVDLGTVDVKTMRNAIDSCGWMDWYDWQHDTSVTQQQKELALVEALHSYGAYAPLWNENGNNFRKLLAEAKQESRALDDEELHEEAMNRRVNAIGSTAREYARGDLDAALVRTLRGESSPIAGVLAKVYNSCDHTLGAGPISKDVKSAAAEYLKRNEGSNDAE